MQPTRLTATFSERAEENKRIERKGPGKSGSGVNNRVIIIYGTCCLLFLCPMQ